MMTVVVDACRCLTVQEDRRPDIVGVSSHIASVVLTQLDTERKQNFHLHKKLDRERRRRTHKSAPLHCTLYTVLHSTVWMCDRSDDVVYLSDRTNDRHELIIMIELRIHSKHAPCNDIHVHVAYHSDRSNDQAEPTRSVPCIQSCVLWADLHLHLLSSNLSM